MDFYMDFEQYTKDCIAMLDMGGSPVNLPSAGGDIDPSVNAPIYETLLAEFVFNGIDVSGLRRNND